MTSSTATLLTHLGSKERRPDSVAFASFWVIPGGWDYVNARVQSVWLDETSAEMAKPMIAKLSNPPEMAFMVTAEEFDKAQASRARVAS